MWGSTFQPPLQDPLQEIVSSSPFIVLGMENAWAIVSMWHKCLSSGAMTWKRQGSHLQRQIWLNIPAFGSFANPGLRWGTCHLAWGPCRGGGACHVGTSRGQANQGTWRGGTCHLDWGSAVPWAVLRGNMLGISQGPVIVCPAILKVNWTGDLRGGSCMCIYIYIRHICASKASFRVITEPQPPHHIRAGSARHIPDPFPWKNAAFRNPRTINLQGNSTNSYSPTSHSFRNCWKTADLGGSFRKRRRNRSHQRLPSQDVQKNWRTDWRLDLPNIPKIPQLSLQTSQLEFLSNRSGWVIHNQVRPYLGWVSYKFHSSLDGSTSRDTSSHARFL